jgi:uncharacterized membrane protein YfcA
MESSILLFLLVSFGALISSLTGLGGGTIILAGLMMVYPPEIALPLHSFTQFTANAIRSGLHFRLIDWRVVGAYAALMLPAAWLGAAIFDYINPGWLKIIVGVVILISVMPIKIKKSNAEPSLQTFYVIGAISGFLGIFVGAVGPMVIPFFNRLKLNRDAMLVTKSAGQMFLQLSKIIAFSGAAGINFGDLKSQIGLLIIGSLIGVLASIPLGRKLSDDKFNKIVTVLLVIISFKVLFEGVKELFLN